MNWVEQAGAIRGTSRICTRQMVWCAFRTYHMDVHDKKPTDGNCKFVYKHVLSQQKITFSEQPPLACPPQNCRLLNAALPAVQR